MLCLITWIHDLIHCILNVHQWRLISDLFLTGTIFDEAELAEFAALGSYCEYDLFGIETSLYTHNLKVDMPSDAQRIQKIQLLIEQGYTDKIVIAHDIHTKHRLVR